MSSSVSELDRASLDRFKGLLRINTITSNGADGAYQKAVDFMAAVGHEIGLTSKVLTMVPGKPILLLTWLGEDPKLPTILLNGHYDVVPCARDSWTTDPFDPVEKDGNIYARGSQDMKCVLIQYLEAIRRLRAQGVSRLKRTVHLSFVPDEEIGGFDGMARLIVSQEFKALNVGSAMDEGIASTTDTMSLFYGERAIVQGIISAEGCTGHASRLVKDSSIERLLAVCDKLREVRAEQEALLANSSKLKLADVQALNITVLEAGFVKTAPDGTKQYALNVIPSKGQIGFDTRIPVTTDIDTFKAKLNDWCAANGCRLQITSDTKKHGVSSVDRSESPFFKAITETLEKRNIKYETQVFPAATDSRYLRQLGIPSYGFSPMKNCPVLLHEHNEYIPVQLFLDGIPIYMDLIKALGNC